MDDLLADAAFGLHPGGYPLPAARTPLQSWHRSIALAGQGRYSQAYAESARFPDRSAAEMSLVQSTRASWMRQMGAHDRASTVDGRALAFIGFESGEDAAVEARCDALTGLAADALGSGRCALAETLLNRCAVELESVDLWRPSLRLSWVRAELAMATGHGTAALRHALDAREAANDADSLRHRVKTELIVAAAQCVSGDAVAAVATAATVVDRCAAHGLVPLRWAAAMLLVGLGAGEQWVQVRDAAASTIGGRGGGMST